MIQKPYCWAIVIALLSQVELYAPISWELEQADWKLTRTALNPLDCNLWTWSSMLLAASPENTWLGGLAELAWDSSSLTPPQPMTVGLTSKVWVTGVVQLSV